jgi:hypothetical protein
MISQAKFPLLEEEEQQQDISTAAIDDLFKQKRKCRK